MNGRLGDFAWQVLAPHRGAPEAKDSNDGSIAMLWESEETALFTLADLGEQGQLRIGLESSAMLASGFTDKTVVVKVAHHGSRYQDLNFMKALSPRISIISVGKDNTYGHPAPQTIAALSRIGSTVYRTDQDGALAINARRHRVKVRKSHQAFKFWQFD
mgnify:CR=1 FL=1